MTVKLTSRGIGKLVATAPDDGKPIGTEEIILSVNDFPYNFTSDVVSYLVWKNKEEGKVEISEERARIDYK